MRKNSLSLLSLLLCFFLTSCQSPDISGNAFLLQQQAYYHNLEAVYNSLDDIFALYLLGSMNLIDFQNELLLLEKQINLCINKYEQEKAQIAPGSHSFASKAGTEALDRAGIETRDFLNTALVNSEDLEHITKQYMIFQENILEQLSVYITAKEMIAIRNGENSHE